MNETMQDVLDPTGTVTSESSTLTEEVRKLYKKHEFQEIIKLLTEEVLNKLNNSELFSLRALVNYRLDYDTASTMNYAQKALNIDPPYYLSYYVKALILTSKNENKKQ